MDYHYEYSIYNSHHKLVVNRQSAKTNILKKFAIIAHTTIQNLLNWKPCVSTYYELCCIVQSYI